jgi:hypothetical protein
MAWSLVTDYTLDGRRVIGQFPAEEGDFSLLQSVWNAFGASQHPIHWVPAAKQSGHEAATCLHREPRFRMHGAPPSPIHMTAWYAQGELSCHCVDSQTG